MYSDDDGLLSQHEQDRLKKRTEILLKDPDIQFDLVVLDENLQRISTDWQPNFLDVSEKKTEEQGPYSTCLIPKVAKSGWKRVLIRRKYLFTALLDTLSKNRWFHSCAWDSRLLDHVRVRSERPPASIYVRI